MRQRYGGRVSRQIRRSHCTCCACSALQVMRTCTRASGAACVSSSGSPPLHVAAFAFSNAGLMYLHPEVKGMDQLKTRCK